MKANNLIQEAHAYLCDNGCMGMGQQYTALKVERMLADFAAQQISKKNCVIIGREENKQYCDIVSQKMDKSK